MELTHTHTHTYTHSCEHITLQLSAPTSPHSEPWHFTLDTLLERDISFLFCFFSQNLHQSERLLLLLYLYLTWWPFSAAKKKIAQITFCPSSYGVISSLPPLLYKCSCCKMATVMLTALLYHGKHVLWHISDSWGYWAEGRSHPVFQNMHQV